jgi:hypothetical protein
MWAFSAIFNKPSKVNNHPVGENSPNLVTLLLGQTVSRKNEVFLLPT